MAKIYKIHPAIGIMRVGDNLDAFFIGPEKVGDRGVEITSTGAEAPVENYKADGRIKRQAARFRIWEYEQTPTGAVTPLREITANEATITWKATLVNSKAAGPKIIPRTVGSADVMVPGTARRNSAIADRESLIIRGGSLEISGAGQPPKLFDKGKFFDKPVTLGEVRTDGAGRLLVLGGKGDSQGIAPPGGATPTLSDWANNNRWHDDVSDGPVTATVTFNGQTPIVAAPAWVICAPPDFAPGVGGVVSLYEIALQAAIDRGWRTEPAIPSFRNDIFPMLLRSVGLRWVHDWAYWNTMPRDWVKLSDKTNPLNRDLREAAAQKIKGNTLHEFRMPPYLDSVLDKWVEGDFQDDWGTTFPPLSEPEALDRAALEACIGANFYPGIEAGFLITTKEWYAEPFRISHSQVVAGKVTEGMALPWQADFNDCADDWWPSQRPNSVYKAAADLPGSDVDWSRGVSSGGSAASRENLRRNLPRLGFITPKEQGGETLQLEGERDPTLPGT